MRVREGVDRGKPWRRGGLVMRGEEVFILFCHDIVSNTPIGTFIDESRVQTSIKAILQIIVGIEELVPFSNVHGALRQRLIIQTNGRRIQ